MWGGPHHAGTVAALHAAVTAGRNQMRVYCPPVQSLRTLLSKWRHNTTVYHHTDTRSVHVVAKRCLQSCSTAFFQLCI